MAGWHAPTRSLTPEKFATRIVNVSVSATHVACLRRAMHDPQQLELWCGGYFPSDGKLVHRDVGMEHVLVDLRPVAHVPASAAMELDAYDLSTPSACTLWRRSPRARWSSGGFPGRVR